MSITRAKTSSVAQGPSTKKTLLGGNDVILGGSYDAIGVVDVGSGGQSSISFTSIPSTYKHLQIRCFVRNTSGAGRLRMQMNGNTGGNYSTHLLVGDGSTVAGFAGASIVQISAGANVNATASVFSAGVIDILDYSNSTTNKTVRVLAGVDNNGSGEVAFTSGTLLSTSVITSILLYIDALTIGQYSSFALYGIK
jgi:hypothetical protein